MAHFGLTQAILPARRASVGGALPPSVAQFDAVARPHRSGLASRTTNADAFSTFFILAHVPLAQLMRQSPTVSTVHALLTFAVGMWWAVSGASSARVLSVVAYAVGADVLWRMTDASVLWEFGKYSIAAISLVAIATRANKFRIWPAVYFALLVPSALFVLNQYDLNFARKRISFNLSGPFALACTAMFISSARLTRSDVVKILRAAIGPLTAILALAAFSTLTSTLRLGMDSNSTTSGGFGPNQTSASLGLGCFIAFASILFGASGRMLKPLLLALLLVFAMQCALTMSRGGLAMTFGACFVASVQLLWDSKHRSKVVRIVGFFLLLGAFVIIPRLDRFTDGALVRRFTDFNTTGRAQILMNDLETWARNPLLGVGPGLAIAYRDLDVAAHTEYSRLLAEHGVFGLFAGIVLFMAMLQNYFQQRDRADRALVAALFTWALLYMAANGMRNPAPAFLFAMGAAWCPPVRSGLSTIGRQCVARRNEYR